jgi:putative SOS response-associated peptidase YedK
MCGRAYETYTEEELALRYLNGKAKRKPLGIKPNYNLSPTQLSPIVLVRDSKRVLENFRWGLVPFWAKDVKSAAKYSLINAKAEEISEKRSYKQAFEQRRCIVPLSGFIEWKRVDAKTKFPFAISLNDEPIMSVAGVWEHWESTVSGEVIDSFSILTIGANSFMEKIHDRMPVILARDSEEDWLDPEIQEPAILQKILKPCPAGWLQSYELSTAINSPKNNRAEVLEPIKK